MAIENLDDLIAASADPRMVFDQRASITATAANWYSHWLVANGLVGSVPGTGSGTAYSRTNSLLPFRPASGGNKLYLARAVCSASTLSTLMVADRLVATSGLVWNSTAEQMVDTVALPARGGDGEGCRAYLEWYVASGTTARDATVKYTSSDDAARTVTVPVPASRQAGAVVPIPLHPGDSGVKAVESVQLSVGLSTAGNFGVTIAKPLMFTSFGTAYGASEAGPISLALPEIDNDACLYTQVYATTTATGITMTALTLVEG